MYDQVDDNELDDNELDANDLMTYNISAIQSITDKDPYAIRQAGARGAAPGRHGGAPGPALPGRAA